MRDYKFRQHELPLRSRSRGPGRALPMILGIAVLSGLGYAAYWWLNQRGSEPLPPQPVETDSRIIPLTLPPQPSSSDDGSATDTPTRNATENGG